MKLNRSAIGTGLLLCLAAAAVVTLFFGSSTTAPPTPPPATATSAPPAIRTIPLPAAIPNGLAAKVAAFEKALHTITPADTQASRTARIQPFVTPQYLAKFDFAPCNCAADAARTLHGLTVHATVDTNGVDIEQDKGAYFASAVVAITVTDKTGAITNQYILPVHHTTWVKTTAGWQAADGDTE